MWSFLCDDRRLCDKHSCINGMCYLNSHWSDHHCMIDHVDSIYKMVLVLLYLKINTKVSCCKSLILTHSWYSLHSSWILENNSMNYIQHTISTQAGFLLIACVLDAYKFELISGWHWWLHESENKQYAKYVRSLINMHITNAIWPSIQWC